MNLNDILTLCRDNRMPTTGWTRTSMPDNPLQIYDRPGYKALIDTTSGRVTIFNRKFSALYPVIDTNSNITTEQLMAKNGWKMINSGKGYRIAECITGVA
jgi:hypothetical protein